MPIGWFVDLAEADDYFINERYVTDCWDDLGSGSGNTLKDKLLLNAYNRLYYSKEFIPPTYIEATADDLVVLTKAQAEMAYYLCVHMDDEDRRKGIEAQAVIEAGIVKEKYDKDKLYDTAIPQFVRDLLCAYLAGDDTMFGIVDIGREDEVSAKEKLDLY